MNLKKWIVIVGVVIVVGVAFFKIKEVVLQRQQFDELKKMGEGRSMDAWTIVILGATGDLSKRKLIPAIYNGIKKGSTEASHGLFFGAAREKITGAELLERARPFIAGVQTPIFDYLKERTYYVPVDATKEEDFVALYKAIVEQEKAHGMAGKRLIYCALGSEYFISVTNSLVASGIMEKGNANHRIAYEKPFGTDVASAQAINKDLQEKLSDDQIYRVDHYLTKELVNNIVIVRFTNSILERAWDKSTVERIEIDIDETLGVEGRAGFYDHYGALKDVVQNHLLQLLALTTMERPDALTRDAMADKKAAELNNLVVDAGMLGQYEGYLSEKGVKPDSKTDTFVALRMHSKNPRWQGVPIFATTGKALAHKKTEIRVIFKQVGECFVQAPDACANNVFTFRIQPNEGIALQINAREPQDCRDELCRISHYGLTPVLLDFCHSCQFGPYAPEAYEILLQSIMAGDTEIGVSAQEIEAQWAIVEQVQALNLPLYPYKKGSTGPAELEQLWKQ